MTDLIIILIIAILLTLSVGYIRKKRKSGARCVGCPHAGNCAGGCTGTDK